MGVQYSSVLSVFAQCSGHFQIVFENSFAKLILKDNLTENMSLVNDLFFHIKEITLLFVQFLYKCANHHLSTINGGLFIGMKSSPEVFYSYYYHKPIQMRKKRKF